VVGETSFLAPSDGGIKSSKMSINVVMRESEDDFEVFSVASTHDLDDLNGFAHDLNEVLNEGGSNRQILLNVAAHMFNNYQGSSWAIKVEQWNGGVYWFSFEGVALSESSRPSSPIPESIKRVSRYERDPVI